MNIFKRKQEKSIFDIETERVITEMGIMHPDEEDYTTAVKNLKTLQEAAAIKPDPPIKKEAVLAIVGNLAITMLILNFEKADVIATKALSFISKPRI